MSELAPRSNPRLENFEANKAKKEQEDFEEALYADAGESDFSDTDSVDYGNLAAAVKEARGHGRKINREDYAQMPENVRNAHRRLEEADAYERHMEALAGDERSPLERTLDRVESGELSDHTDPLVEEAYVDNDHHDALAMNRDHTIENTKELRYANQLAERIAELYNKPVGEAVEEDEKNIKYLEDRLSVLLEKYSETDGADSAIIDQIIDRSHSAPEAARSTASKESAKGETDPNLGTPEELAALAAAANGDPSLGTPEELAALAAAIGSAPEKTEKRDGEENYMDDVDAARPEALKEYETREGKAYDVDEGRVADVDQAHIEAIKEYEDREGKNYNPDQGRTTDKEKAEVEAIEEAKRRVTPDELEAAHEEALNEDAERTENKKWWKHPMARLGSKFTVNSWAARERWENRDRRKSKFVLAAVGAVAAVGIALWVKNGGHIGGGNGHHQDALDTPKGNGGGSPDQVAPAPKNPAEFSDAARTAHNGEGWLNQLQDMNVPESERADLLHKILESNDPGIKEWVYEMNDGNPGISHPGAIPTDVLESIQALRNK